MKGFDLLQVGRILDRIFLGVVVSGIAMTMIWLGFVAYHGDFQPFPTFGADAQINQITGWFLVGFGCFWLIWAISFGRRAIRFDWPNPAFAYLLSLAAVLVGSLAWYVSIPMLNALLDFSPKIVTPVYVQRKSSTPYRTLHGTKLTGRSAVVNRLDHPEEHVDVSWQWGCKGVAGIPSRIATIKLGRGAFGVPWFSLPAGCRPLAVDERPLSQDFYLGKGRAAVLVALRTGRPQSEAAAARADDYARRKSDLLASLTRLAEGHSKLSNEDAYNATADARFVLTEGEQEELKRILQPLPGKREQEMAIGRQALSFVKAAVFKRDRAKLLELWTRAIESRFPDAEMVILADSAPLAPEHRAACPHCREILEQELDSEILEVFMAGKDPWEDGSHIYDADRMGQMIFQAALSDIDQEPRLLQKLALQSASSAAIPVR